VLFGAAMVIWSTPLTAECGLTNAVPERVIAELEQQGFEFLRLVGTTIPGAAELMLQIGTTMSSES
jgi:hypothetical protein